MSNCLFQTKETCHPLFQFCHQFLHCLCPQHPLDSLQVCEVHTANPRTASVCSRVTVKPHPFQVILFDNYLAKTALAFLFLLKSIHIVKYYINYTSGCVELLMWLEPHLRCVVLFQKWSCCVKLYSKKSGISEIIFNKKYFLRSDCMF